MDILEVIVHLSLIYIFLVMLHLIMEFSWQESARTFQILISLSMPLWQLNASKVDERKVVENASQSCFGLHSCSRMFFVL